MSKDQNIRFHSLRSRREALLANPLPESDKNALYGEATRCLLAAQWFDAEIALHDAEFIIRRVEQGREQISAMVAIAKHQMKILDSRTSSIREPRPCPEITTFKLP